MTNEELKRIRQYATKIQATDNSLAVLTDYEAEDLEALVRKRIEEGK